MEEVFPGAIQILDRFHVKQHLSDVAKDLYGPVSELGGQWSKARDEELDAGRIDDILAVLLIHSDVSEEACQCIGYVETNRKRMRYPDFHAAGLCTSSGVVEAGCKVAIGHRLNRAGMHWSVHGSQAIGALRCDRLSHASKTSGNVAQKGRLMPYGSAPFSSRTSHFIRAPDRSGGVLVIFPPFVPQVTPNVACVPGGSERVLPRARRSFRRRGCVGSEGT